MTVEEQLKNAGIDWDTTVKRFCGNENLYLRFLKKFTEDETFRQLKEAWYKKDIEQTERSAHTLKGTCANLGITLLAGKADRIVQAMRSPGKEECFEQEELLSDCEREYMRIWTLLKELT